MYQDWNTFFRSVIDFILDLFFSSLYTANTIDILFTVIEEF